MSFKFYARIKDSVLQQGYGLDNLSFELTKEKYPNDIFLEINYFCDPDLYYFKNGSILKKPIKPSDSCFWSDEYLSWVENSYVKEFEVKQQRNILLMQSDWTQIPNGPLTLAQQANWSIYRQFLRDITAQSGYPFDVIWPTPPT